MSPCLKGLPSDRLIIQEDSSTAYNDAIEKAKTDLVAFAHQDVYFPPGWLLDLNRSLKMLEDSDPDWCVLGCSGIKYPDIHAGYLYSLGLGILGGPFEQPTTIDTLDGFILILHESSGLRFDPTLPLFHFYGTDICMSARKQKCGCYAPSPFTVHNTSDRPLAPEFYKCYWHAEKRRKEFLPISDHLQSRLPGGTRISLFAASKHCLLLPDRSKYETTSASRRSALRIRLTNTTRVMAPQSLLVRNSTMQDACHAHSDRKSQPLCLAV